MEVSAYGNDGYIGSAVYQEGMDKNTFMGKLNTLMDTDYNTIVMKDRYGNEMVMSQQDFAFEMPKESFVAILWGVIILIILAGGVIAYLKFGKMFGQIGNVLGGVSKGIGSIGKGVGDMGKGIGTGMGKAGKEVGKFGKATGEVGKNVGSNIGKVGKSFKKIKAPKIKAPKIKKPW